MRTIQVETIRKGFRLTRRGAPMSACALFLFVLLPSLPVSAQQDDFQRSLENFDRRAEQVRVLVDSSRIPEADALFQSAVRTRDQAEAAHRRGDTAGARALIDRALALLVQAENRAREGGDPGVARRLTGLLKSLRQSLQDSQRWLRDLETKTRSADQVGSVKSFLDEQKDRSESLLARAGRECSNSNSERCRDLIDRGRLLFERGEQLLESSLAPTLGDDPAVQNRLRDARQFLDRAQTELDLIQQEVGGEDRPNPAVLSRIRNVENLIRLGNDRLQEADLRTGAFQQGQSGAILNLFRRSNELAHLALRSIDGGTLLQRDYDERSTRVEAIRTQVEKEAGGEISSVAGYQEGLNFQNQAEQQAQGENYEQALLLLARAASSFNNALARVNSNLGGANADQVYLDLKAKFERDYRDAIASTPANEPLRAACSDRLALARETAERAEEAHESGNLLIALSLLNQAQQTLNEAKTCLGQSSPKIGGVLDRLQVQFDKRLPLVESSVGDDAADPRLLEAKSLRRLSDVQEANGEEEAAVQTVGRAIRILGEFLRSIGDPEEGVDSNLVVEHLGKYDARSARVRELVERRADSASMALLKEADRMRRESEEASASGNPRLGLNRISQAIGLLEQAARGER